MKIKHGNISKFVAQHQISHPSPIIEESHLIQLGKEATTTMKKIALFVKAIFHFLKEGSLQAALMKKIILGILPSKSLPSSICPS